MTLKVNDSLQAGSKRRCSITAYTTLRSTHRDSAAPAHCWTLVKPLRGTNGRQRYTSLETHDELQHVLQFPAGDLVVNGFLSCPRHFCDRESRQIKSTGGKTLVLLCENSIFCINTSWLSRQTLPNASLVLPSRLSAAMRLLCGGGGSVWQEGVRCICR